MVTLWALFTCEHLTALRACGVRRLSLERLLRLRARSHYRLLMAPLSLGGPVLVLAPPFWAALGHAWCSLAC